MILGGLNSLTLPDDMYDTLEKRNATVRDCNIVIEKGKICLFQFNIELKNGYSYQ